MRPRERPSETLVQSSIHKPGGRERGVAPIVKVQALHLWGWSHGM